MRESELAGNPASSGASCHGSFGELLQGALPEQGPFLVTLPIERHARAHFVARQSARELRVDPPSSWKARHLAEALLCRYALPARGELTLNGEIPRGKGLASSTADLVATYRAITRFHRLPQNTEVLESLLREIEPSDGVMHEGVVAYRHREARLLEPFGPVPRLVLVAVDEGGEVETLAHNERQPAYSQPELEEFASLLARLRHAFRDGNLAAIGAVATRSAELNQRLLPKRTLGAMIGVAAAVGAMGVVAAHSGTCLALMIDASDAPPGYEPHCLRALRLLDASAAPPDYPSDCLHAQPPPSAAGADRNACRLEDRIQAARERLLSLGLHSTTFTTLRGRALSEPVHA